MSTNATAWITLINAADAAGTLPPAPVTLTGFSFPGASAGPVSIDTPDAKGLVAFTNLPSGNSYSGVRIAVQEVGLSSPPSSEQRECCLNAVAQASQKYNITQFIGVATDSKQVYNPSTGANDWVTISPQVNIPNSQALPALTVVVDGQSFNCATIAGAGAYLLYMGAKPQRPPVVNTPFGGAGQGALSSTNQAAKAANQAAKGK